MRIEKECVIAAPREDVWELVSDPTTWPAFMYGITRFERQGDVERGCGARFSMRMRVGSAEVGGLIEIVEFDEPGDLAWTSVTGIDQRGRWRLRESDDGGTKVTLRLSYDAPGGLLGAVTDRVAAPTVSRNLERTLQNLRRELEGGDVGVSDGGKSLPGKVVYELGSVKVLVDAGVVRPIRPDRLVKFVQVMSRFGRSPAAGVIMHATRYPDAPMIVDEVGTLSFGEVDRRTNALAHAFADAGLVEGDAMAIMCRNHRGFIESTVALSKLGVDSLYL
ncbi:MAG TPA: SRPBCC family protein, partial [Thermoleophilaceae bacterium]